MASISNLTPELMQHILDLCDPPAHLNLALACKTLQRRIDFILRYNQECHSKYRAISDIHPTTVPHIVRDIFIKDDKVAAWHIRSIEIWGTRVSWDDWNQSIHLVEPSQGGNPISLNPGPFTPFTESELDVLKQFMVQNLAMADIAADGWLSDVNLGKDAPLKVVLIALSPQLRAVRFIRRSATVQTPSMDFATLTALKNTIEQISVVSKSENFSGEGRNRAPGLSSVQQIALGLSSRAFSSYNEQVILASQQQPFEGTQMSHVRPLFLLPGLKSLYIYGFNDGTSVWGVTGNNQIRPSAYWELPPASCPIETLCFESPENPENDPMEALVEACGKLRHLTFINGSISGQIEGDAVLHWTKSARANSTLKSVLWCGTQVYGYKSDMYDQGLYNEPAFNILTVSIDDAILGGWEPESEKSEKEFVEYVSELFEHHLTRVFVEHGMWTCPDEVLERVLLAAVRGQCWSSHDSDDSDDSDEEGHVTDEEAQLGEQGDETKKGSSCKREGEKKERFPCGCLPNSEDCQYPFYSEGSGPLYLEGIEPRCIALESCSDDVRRQDAPMKRPFGKLIRFCKLWGVGIFTRTLPAPRVHKGEMPTILSEKDLETSPWYKHPDVERVYFKPHVGLVDDCANCGECGGCYALHPPEAWAAWKEEDAKLDEERRRIEVKQSTASKEDQYDGQYGEDGGEDSEDEAGRAMMSKTARWKRIRSNRCALCYSKG